MDKSDLWYRAEALEELALAYERLASPLALARALDARRRAVDTGLQALAESRAARSAGHPESQPAILAPV